MLDARDPVDGLNDAVKRSTGESGLPPSTARRAAARCSFTDTARPRRETR